MLGANLIYLFILAVDATTYQAIATYFTPAQGGTAICGRVGGYY